MQFSFGSNAPNVVPTENSRSRCADLDVERAREGLLSALQFLAAAQRADGSWRDFQLDVGESSSWVTGYVAYHLRHTPQTVYPSIGVMTHKALSFLQNSQGSNGGWGYNEQVVCDCDSTAYAILALHMHGLVAVTPATTFLRKHHIGNGLFATFRHKSGSHPWSLPHPEVGATAIAALCDRTLAVEFLRHARAEMNRFGRLAAFWWEDDAYLLWAIVMMAKSFNLESSLAFMLEHIRKYVAKSAFSHGLLGQALLVLGERSIALRHWNTISNIQMSDGSWMPSAGMRYVQADSALTWLKWREAKGCIHLDTQRVFTTATVVGFLGSLLSQIEVND